MAFNGGAAFGSPAAIGGTRMAVGVLRQVTKGNKKFAGSAGIRESVKVWAIARRASLEQPQRVTETDLEMVRDTGFEPVTPTVSM